MHKFGQHLKSVTRDWFAAWLTVSSCCFRGQDNSDSRRHFYIWTPNFVLCRLMEWKKLVDEKSIWREKLFSRDVEKVTLGRLSIRMSAKENIPHVLAPGAPLTQRTPLTCALSFCKWKTKRCILGTCIQKIIESIFWLPFNDK